jgi:tetratricopeptide (TPR) repeat protein
VNPTGPLPYDGLFERLRESLRDARHLQGSALGRLEQAESLRAELLAHPEAQWLARLHEDPRFLSSDLMELLLEACHTTLAHEPRRALFLSQLTVELARLLGERSGEPDTEMLCRALCLGSHASRLLRDHPGAEAFLAKSAFLARDLGSRGFYLRSLALLRCDQGRTEEALALLHQAGRRFEELEDTAEEAVCLALLGLLYTDQDELDLAAPLLLKAKTGLVGQRRPWLSAQTHLCLALCFALAKKSQQAHSLRESAWAFYSGLQCEDALYSLFWREAQVVEALGDLAPAGRLFDSVRLKLIANDQLAEAALVTVQLGLLLYRQGRAAEARTLSSELAAAFAGRPGLEFSLTALQCLAEDESVEGLPAVESSTLRPGFLLALKARGELPQPMPFV